MIDWVTIAVAIEGYHADLAWRRRAGCTIWMRPHGGIDHVVDRWLPIAGSYDSAMHAKPAARGLWLSGNPAKLLTGQNADGSDDLQAIMDRLIAATAPALAPAIVGLPLVGTLSRVDITQSYDLGSVERVREVLRVAAITARARRQGASSTSHQTVYLGRHSRRHSVKLYAKADELAAHPPLALPPDVRRSLMEQSQGLLRIEVTLRGQQLKDDGIQQIGDWSGPTVAEQQWARYWSAIDLSSGVELTPDDVLALPRRFRRTYDAWRRGADLQELLSRSQYYVHKRELLALTGGAIDISVLRPSVVTQDIASRDIGAYLRSLKTWHATGRLAEWIAETAA